MTSHPPTPHQTRIARNEAAFREINATLASQGGRARTGFVCECGDETCRRLIDLDPEEYRAVRSDPRHFFVVPGHEMLSTENVVTRHEDRYHVVEKLAEVAHVVES